MTGGIMKVEYIEQIYAGYLIPALDRLKQEGLLQNLHEKICIGQGYRGKTGKLGIGHCTKKFRCPLEGEIYDFLKNYILEHHRS